MRCVSLLSLHLSKTPTAFFSYRTQKKWIQDSFSSSPRSDSARSHSDPIFSFILMSSSSYISDIPLNANAASAATLASASSLLNEVDRLAPTGNANLEALAARAEALGSRTSVVLAEGEVLRERGLEIDALLAAARARLAAGAGSVGARHGAAAAERTAARHLRALETHAATDVALADKAASDVAASRIRVDALRRNAKDLRQHFSRASANLAAAREALVSELSTANCAARERSAGRSAMAALVAEENARDAVAEAEALVRSERLAVLASEAAAAVKETGGGEKDDDGEEGPGSGDLTEEQEEAARVAIRTADEDIRAAEATAQVLYETTARLSSVFSRLATHVHAHSLQDLVARVKADEDFANEAVERAAHLRGRAAAASDAASAAERISAALRMKLMEDDSAQMHAAVEARKELAAARDAQRAGATRRSALVAILLRTECFLLRAFIALGGEAKRVGLEEVNVINTSSTSTSLSSTAPRKLPANILAAAVEGAEELARELTTTVAVALQSVAFRDAAVDALHAAERMESSINQDIDTTTNNNNNNNNQHMMTTSPPPNSSSAPPPFQSNTRSNPTISGFLIARRAITGLSTPGAAATLLRAAYHTEPSSQSKALSASRGALSKTPLLLPRIGDVIQHPQQVLTTHMLNASASASEPVSFAFTSSSPLQLRGGLISASLSGSAASASVNTMLEMNSSTKTPPPFVPPIFRKETTASTAALLTSPPTTTTILRENSVVVALPEAESSRRRHHLAKAKAADDVIRRALAARGANARAAFPSTTLMIYKKNVC